MVLGSWMGCYVVRGFFGFDSTKKKRVKTELGRKLFVWEKEENEKIPWLARMGIMSLSLNTL